jgi:hypothetical protein
MIMNDECGRPCEASRHGFLQVLTLSQFVLLDMMTMAVTKLFSSQASLVRSRIANWCAAVNIFLRLLCLTWWSLGFFPNS